MPVNKNYLALKRGGYSTTTILPTESIAEFEKLHEDLILELVPLVSQRLLVDRR